MSQATMLVLTRLNARSSGDTLRPATGPTGGPVSGASGTGRVTETGHRHLTSTPSIAALLKRDAAGLVAAVVQDDDHAARC